MFHFFLRHILYFFYMIMTFYGYIFLRWCKYFSACVLSHNKDYCECKRYQESLVEIRQQTFDLLCMKKNDINNLFISLQMIHRLLQKSYIYTTKLLLLWLSWATGGTYWHVVIEVVWQGPNSSPCGKSAAC